MDELSKETKMFQLILTGTPEEGLDVYHSYANDEAFAETVAFALEAACAMDDQRHEGLNLGAKQCGYDDGIYEGEYDFESFACHCPKCRADYDEGFAEGMKEIEDGR